MKILLYCSAAVLLFAFLGYTVMFAAPQDPTTGKPFPKLFEETPANTVNPEPSEATPSEASSEQSSEEPKPQEEIKLETATFANGCFWCTEAVFQRLKGVESVRSGYIGGRVENPSYRDVCSGSTGHAEALEIVYDPAVITFDALLEVFWQTHDPTTLNRQGNDIGTQYRSGIFYHNEQQKELAEQYKKKLDEAGVFNNPIVTEVTAASTFYAAEDYHQNYFNQNKQQAYCRAVITPKVEKLKKVFADKLK